MPLQYRSHLCRQRQLTVDTVLSMATPPVARSIRSHSHDKHDTQRSVTLREAVSVRTPQWNRLANRCAHRKWVLQVTEVVYYYFVGMWNGLFFALSDIMPCTL